MYSKPLWPHNTKYGSCRCFRPTDYETWCLLHLSILRLCFSRPNKVENSTENFPLLWTASTGLHEANTLTVPCGMKWPFKQFGAVVYLFRRAHFMLRRASLRAHQRTPQNSNTNSTLLESSAVFLHTNTTRLELTLNYNTVQQEPGIHCGIIKRTSLAI
jgi:hypothetical protein